MTRILWLLIPTSSAGKLASGCSSSGDKRGMLLLHPIRGNYKFPWYSCNFWIIDLIHKWFIFRTSNQLPGKICQEVKSLFCPEFVIFWILLPSFSHCKHKCLQDIRSSAIKTTLKVLREDPPDQIVCFFEHCSRRGGGHPHVQKLMLQLLYNSGGSRVE